jgi:hypothetical protein
MIEMGNQLGWVALDTPEGIVAFIFGIVVLLLALFAAGQAAAIREEEALLADRAPARASARADPLARDPRRDLRGRGGPARDRRVAGRLGRHRDRRHADRRRRRRARGRQRRAARVAGARPRVALLGLVPRLTAPLTYGLVLAAYLLDFVGGVLELPEAVLDASPFRQLAAVPAESLAPARWS